MSETPMPDVFDDSHHAATLLRKVKRSFQLGPKYYLVDVPRYFRHRRALGLPAWDLRALANPLREFSSRPFHEFPTPPGYLDALRRLSEAGIRLTIPQVRLEGLLGAWWSARSAGGSVIECGSYRGATALLIALLGRMNQIDQPVHLLDTFAGIPATSQFDVGRSAGEFAAPEDQVSIIRHQGEVLEVGNRIEVHQGLFSESFERLEPRGLRFAFVHIDANIYQGTWEACQFTIPRTSAGGVVVFDDYNGVCDLGARLAIDKYCADCGLEPKPLAASSAWLRISAALPG